MFELKIELESEIMFLTAARFSDLILALQELQKYTVYLLHRIFDAFNTLNTHEMS